MLDMPILFQAPVRRDSSNPFVCSMECLQPFSTPLSLVLQKKICILLYKYKDAPSLLTLSPSEEEAGLEESRNDAALRRPW